MAGESLGDILAAALRNNNSETKENTDMIARTIQATWNISTFEANKISIIKAVRTATDCGLKTANDFVEAALDSKVKVTKPQMLAINAQLREDDVSMYEHSWDAVQLTTDDFDRVMDWSTLLDCD